MQIKFGRYTIPLPHSKYLRMALGLLFITGWFFSWLPLLGFWLLPLGLMVLSVDLPFLAPVRDRVVCLCQKFGRWCSLQWQRFNISN